MKGKKVLAWALLVASVVGWPASLFLTDEPVFILSLSWLAIIVSALDALWIVQEK